MEKKEYLEVFNKTVKPALGNGTTYMNDIYKYCKKKLGIRFAGIYPSDKIPVLTDLKCYAILNLDNSKQPGSHWIAIAKKKHENIIICYDSFGRTADEIIPSLKRINKGIIKNTKNDAEQRIKENNCGARSVAWLLYYHKNGYEKALKI